VSGPTPAAEGRLLEGRHRHADAEEWLFCCWAPPAGGDGAVGVVSGYRLLGRGRGSHSWYWCAVARAGHALLHVAVWAVPPRADPLLVKSHGLWAEHVCDVPMEQWTMSNETYASALDDPDDALGRAYGTPTAVALDLEWYAVAAPEDVPAGYTQSGVVHGIVELSGGSPLRLDEVPAQRWHRWGDALVPVELPAAYAHAGVRAPFAFPDGTVADWVLTPDGWRTRTTR
jgi:hypothetical protein